MIFSILFAFAAGAHFADPPVDSGILPIRHNPPRSEKAIREDVESLVRLGYGGVACNCHFDGYVARASNWPHFVSYVNALREKGLQVWLYDERGYPSGYAYGLTLEGRPDLQAKGYLVSTNGESFRIEPIFKGTHAEMKLNKDRRPYPDILMREATERFLAVNHDVYVKHFGESFSNCFVSTFTDEPSLMSYWLKRMPELVLPYTPALPELYRKRTGRILENDIKTLAVPDGSVRSQKIRYDYWNLVGELLTENFFGVIDDWCLKHGILSGGHLMSEENFADHVGFYADFLSCLKRMSAPGIDMLTIRPPNIVRITPFMVASARALGGRREAMVEISDHAERVMKTGPVGWSMSEANGAVNLYIWGGITAFPSYLAVGRMKFPDETVRRFNRRTGRLVTLFSKPGEFAADVALVYPASDLKANFIPACYRGGSFEIDELRRTFREVEESLYRHRRPCLAVDEDFLCKAEVRDGRLVRGKLSFRTVVLPEISTLPLAAWKKLEAFRDGGGIVMAVGARPKNDTALFRSDEVARIADSLFSSPAAGSLCGMKRAASGNGAGVYMENFSARFSGRVLDALFGKVLDATNVNTPLRVQHRRMDDGDAFFVFNDSPGPVKDTILICGRSDGYEMWNPDDGTHASASVENGRIPVSLPPYGGVVFTSSAAREASRGAFSETVIPCGGAAGVLRREPFETSRNLTTSSTRGRPYHAEGRIVAPLADTYHWVNFEYAKPPMSGNDSQLIIDVSVSAEDAFEGPSPVVMVFAMCKKKSISFITATRFRLGREKTATLLLTADDFRRFRHSEPLDLSEIDGISVGYGGWKKGKAGDRISFTVRDPKFIR